MEIAVYVALALIIAFFSLRVILRFYFPPDT